MVAPSWESFQTPQTEEGLLPPTPEEESIQQAPEGKKPEWGDFLSPETYQGEEDPTADEDTLQYIIRNTTANASRIAEQALGSVGNLQKGKKELGIEPPSVSDLVNWSMGQLIGKERWEKLGYEEVMKNLPPMVPQFPTSQEFKEFSQEVSGGYTAPKTKGEEKFQEFTEDVGSVLLSRNPAALAKKGASRYLRVAANKLLIPAAANATKQTAKELGLSDNVANLIKIGTWLPLSLATNISGPQYASSLMNRGRKGIPENVHGSVPRIEGGLYRVENALLSSDPRTQVARTAIGDIRRDLANGQTNSSSLLRMYDAINALKRSKGLFDLNRTDRGVAREAVDRVRNVIRDEVRVIGQDYPEALKAWENGVTAWAVIHRSRAITSEFEDLARGPYGKVLSGAAMGLFGAGGVLAPVTTAQGALVTVPVYKGVQTLYRVLQNPTLANYYWKAIAGLETENLPAFINNYNKLNKNLEKEEKSTLRSSR